MQYFSKYKDYLILSSILLLSLVLRTIYLDRIPIAISNDELDFILKSKSVFLSIVGFLHGTGSLQLIPEHPHAEIPYLLLAPITGPLPFSLFNARIFYALMSTFFIFLLFLIAKKLLNRNAALWISLVAVINPWSIFFGRTVFESQLAVFFYFLGFYLLLILKKWKLLWALLPFLIAFFSYDGSKLIFLPFIGLLSYFSYLVIHKKNYKNIFVTIFSTCVIIFFTYILILKFLPDSARVHEVATPFNNVYTTTVNEERKIAIQTPIVKLFANKPIVFLVDATRKYLGAFSTDVLFIRGDNLGIFSLWRIGLFYYTDALLLIIGLFMLYKNHKKLALFLTSLILIAPIPSALSTVDTSYANRSIMLFPLFFILIGYGLSELFIMMQSKRAKITYLSLIGILYLFQLGNFLTIYLFENPIYNSEQFVFQYRILSSYLDRAAQSKRNIMVFTNEPKAVFEQYLFYTNTYNEKTDSMIKHSSTGSTFHYGTLTIKACEKTKPSNENTTYIVNYVSCGKQVASEAASLTIPQISDGAITNKIYHDSLCSAYEVPLYPSSFTLNDFLVENLSNQKFCQTFITH